MGKAQAKRRAKAPRSARRAYQPSPEALAAYARDPLLRMIDEHRELGDKINAAAKRKRKPANLDAIEAKYGTLLDNIEKAVPLSADGLAESILYLSQCSAAHMTLDLSTWTTSIHVGCRSLARAERDSKAARS